MVKLIYSFENNICNELERFRFYPITKELRQVFIEHEPDLRSIPDAFGLISTDWDRMEIFRIMTEKASELGHLDEVPTKFIRKHFNAFNGRYNDEITKLIDRINGN